MYGKININTLEKIFLNNLLIHESRFQHRNILQKFVVYKHFGLSQPKINTTMLNTRDDASSMGSETSVKPPRDAVFTRRLSIIYEYYLRSIINVKSSAKTTNISCDGF